MSLNNTLSKIRFCEIAGTKRLAWNYLFQKSAITEELFFSFCNGQKLEDHYKESKAVYPSWKHDGPGRPSPLSWTKEVKTPLYKYLILPERGGKEKSEKIMVFSSEDIEIIPQFLKWLSYMYGEELKIPVYDNRWEDEPLAHLIKLQKSPDFNGELLVDFETNNFLLMERGVNPNIHQLKKGEKFAIRLMKSK